MVACQESDRILEGSDAPMTPADEAVGPLRDGQPQPPHSSDWEIRRLRARVAQLERERDAAENFAALAAHELMAPLVMTEACLSMATEQLDAVVHKDLLESLGVLGRGAARTRRLVETLLHEARATGQPIRSDAVDLHALALECVALLEPEIKAGSSHVVVGSLPTVRGEAELLAGVITNLLVNALKFNPRQGGRITMGSTRYGGGWTVFIESDGPAILADERMRIFEPFHRGRRERRIRGAGLGLAICRRIVERHGGTIGVMRVQTDRNRFYFTVPD
jgi:signal transduction histidine kinase